MSDAAQTIRQLKLKTGVVKRYVRDELAGIDHTNIPAIMLISPRERPPLTLSDCSRRRNHTGKKRNKLKRGCKS